MHTDVFGNVLEHHRFDTVDAVIQKLGLTLYNALDNAIDRLPSMFNITEQIDGGTHLILDKILGFLGRFRFDRAACDRSG